jgi:hypothetical protein
LIQALWDYSKRLWAFRNSTLHGQDIQEQRQKDKDKLRGNVEQLFDKHATDPFFITQAMNHLFNKPIQYVLSMNRDAIACWIKSVEEANLSRVHMESVSKDSILQFLRPRRGKETDEIKSASLGNNQNKFRIAQVTSSKYNPIDSTTQVRAPDNPRAILSKPKRSACQPFSVPIQQVFNQGQEQAPAIKIKCKRKTQHRQHRVRATLPQRATRVTNKRQADSEAIPRDFSGTYLSMAP